MSFKDKMLLSQLFLLEEDLSVLVRYSSCSCCIHSCITYRGQKLQMFVCISFLV